MKKSHLSEFEIQHLLDLPPGDREHNPGFKHVKACELCSRRLVNTELIHRSLSRDETEPVNEIQVERIMERVRSGRKGSILIPILQRFANIVALILVLGIVGTVFYQFDILAISELRAPAAEATGILMDYYRIIQEQAALFGENIITLYDRYLGVETAPVISFTIMLLILLAVLDRWLLAPMLRRGR